MYGLFAPIAYEHIGLGWSMPPKPGHGIKTSWHVAVLVYAQILLTHAMISHIGIEQGFMFRCKFMVCGAVCLTRLNEGMASTALCHLYLRC